MKDIANLLFEARMLKDLDRSGYPFLGAGRESIAEHCFTMAFVCLIMSRMDPQVNGEKLLAMALIHDLPESRTGDQNYVHKKYVDSHEARAMKHQVGMLPFGDEFMALLEEFNAGQSYEAMLAKDADQLSFILELKKLKDTGAVSPDKWLEIILKRLKTRLGCHLAEGILTTPWDAWWMGDYHE